MAKAPASAYAAAAYTAGFRGMDLRTAVAVGLAESGGNPEAKHENRNGTTDLGGWQINSGAHPEKLAAGQWANLNDNAVMAFKVYAEAGNRFTPWVVYKTGAYLTHIPTAAIAVREISTPSGQITEATIQPARWVPIPGFPLPIPLPGGGGSLNPLEPLQDAADTFADVARFAGKALSLLTSLSFWKRAGIAWLGFVFVVWGLVFLLATTKPGQKAIKTGLKATPIPGGK